MNRGVLLAAPIVLAMLLVAACGTLITGSPSAAQTEPTDDASPPLAIDPFDGSLLRAGGGLFRTRDQGQSWQPVGLPNAVPAQKVRLVATAGGVSSVIYAAGPGVGIVRSTDDGRTWNATGQRLPSQDVTALAVHSFRPDTVYAWIPTLGAFRTEDAGVRWEKMDAGPDAAAPVLVLAHSRLEGSMNTGWLYAGTPEGPYLSMDCF